LEFSDYEALTTPWMSSLITVFKSHRTHLDLNSTYRHVIAISTLYALIMADPTTGDSANSSHEVLDPRKVTLNDIVDTFLAAKRSLLSIELVARAREIVESGRVALEENATLAASNSFVKAAVELQLDSLNGIRAGGKAVEIEGYQELKVSCLRSFRIKLTVSGCCQVS
jgi:hypothetical protein